MIRDPITVRHAVKVLNECVRLDRLAVERLISSRVGCNKRLAEHPSVQVGTYHRRKTYTVGFLGVLNGLFGAAGDHFGAIAAIYEVRCPNGHAVKHEIVGDKCKTCGARLKLGKLLMFTQIRFSGKGSNR